MKTDIIIRIACSLAMIGLTYFLATHSRDEAQQFAANIAFFWIGWILTRIVVLGRL